MRLRNPSGTRVSVPDHLADRYMARGWLPAGDSPPPPSGPSDPSPEAEGPEVPVRGTPENPATPNPEPPADDVPPGVVTMAALTVPDGTAKDVLDWVGDDRQRAAQALDVESRRGDDARSTLVAKLTKLAGK